MENKNYRRRVAVARFGYAFRDEFRKALFDSRNRFIPYRYNSLSKAIISLKLSDASNVFLDEALFPVVYFPSMLEDSSLIPRLAYHLEFDLRVSSLVFYSNGDIDIYFKSFHHKN